jgi:hypothetical protein
MKQKAGSLKKSIRLTDPWQTRLKQGEKKPKSIKSEMQKRR